jgi:hypothetical protein
MASWQFGRGKEKMTIRQHERVSLMNEPQGDPSKNNFAAGCCVQEKHTSALAGGIRPRYSNYMSQLRKTITTLRGITQLPKIHD